MTDTLKYICGCGKAYTSYPAFSTHKRLKHRNQQVVGTSLPRQFVPKRGRPSFTVPQQPSSDLGLTAMTTAEITLLQLQQKYPSILSGHEEDGDLSILDVYAPCQQLIANQTGQTFVNSVKTFNSIVVNHSLDSISVPTTHFLLQITKFILENIGTSTVQLEWEEPNRRVQKIDTCLFNKFFLQKGQKQKLKQYAQQTGKAVTFLLELTVGLSEYLCKMNLMDSVLSLKGSKR